MFLSGYLCKMLLETFGQMSIHMDICSQVLCLHVCSVMSNSLWPHRLQPGSSVHGISQARILEWVAMSYSRGSSKLRELKASLLHWQADSSPLSHLGSLLMSATDIISATAFYYLVSLDYFIRHRKLENS